MLFSICKSRIKLLRNNDTVFSAAAAASTSVSNQPNNDTTVQILLSENSSGTVTVIGELNSASVTSTLTFTNTKVDVTFKEFDTVTTIECSAGLVTAGVTVTAKYMTSEGGNTTYQTTVVDDWPASFHRAKPYGQVNYIASDAGANEIERGFLMTPYVDTWSPRTGDVVVLKETQKQFLVEGVALIQDAGLLQHWEIFLNKISQSVV